MARVRRKHQRLRPNAPIESAPGSMLSPLQLCLPGHSRLSHSVCRDQSGNIIPGSPSHPGVVAISSKAAGDLCFRTCNSLLPKNTPCSFQEALFREGMTQPHSTLPRTVRWYVGPHTMRCSNPALHPRSATAMDGSGCSGPLPSARQREHATRRTVPLIFRRPGRSGPRAWPSPYPWPRTPRRPPVAHCL